MKIVHLSKNDLQGGAAKAAYRLHKGLQRAGQESFMVVISKSGDDPTVIAVNRPMDLLSRVRRGMREYQIAQDFRQYRNSRPAGYEVFSDDRTEYSSTLLSQIPAYDIVNLHWVSGLLAYGSFFARVPQSTPVVWTLHDMNPFTGGCHYSLGCERFLHHCGSCPQLGSRDETDLSHRTWRRKKEIFSRIPPSRLRIVTPSRWLAGAVKRSSILGRFPVTVIPNGLDVDEFAPLNRGSVRELLGVPQDAKVVLFLAELADSQRKGFPLLVQALTRCAELVPKLSLVSLGHNKPQLQVKIPWLHLGPLNNDRFLSMVYNVADLFVICSLEDNLPNTVLEAMACGVPTVGVRVGGIPEMVRDGVNGLTAAADPDALAAAIRDLLNGTERRAAMSASCRRIAVQEYSLERQAQRYNQLYKELIVGGTPALRQNSVPASRETLR
ncbi:MAG: glycosyltransferase family 4 protein [Verrucomicrobia bacterium]|nr:glycosyltransferase family 4 protein [Verrucomicrobiota bacterium]